MNSFQEMISYYANQLHSSWAQKKALAYLRILAEAEGGASEVKPDKTKSQQRETNSAEQIQ
ncbi:MAG: hypothetical protein IJS41_12455 [Clostridia bacterium]|nr:hypothetical protein [Clostridia bacterium]